MPIGQRQAVGVGAGGLTGVYVEPKLPTTVPGYVSAPDAPPPGTVVAGSETRYMPYGEARTDEPPAVRPPSVRGERPLDGVAGLTEFTFTGQQVDGSTGLMYYNARWYDPGAGRFISPDTIVPEPGNPQDFNRYSYVRNNPLKYVDPSGHFSHEELQQILNFDTLDAFYGWFDSIDGWWQDTLEDARWQDEITIGQNTYAFIFDPNALANERCGISTPEFASWAQSITLAFWDVKRSQSAHFIDVLSDSNLSTIRDFTPFGSSAWIKPDYNSGNLHANEYVWFTDGWRSLQQQTRFLILKLEVFMAATVAGGWPGLVGSGPILVDVLDNSLDLVALLSTNYEGETPYLRQGNFAQSAEMWEWQITYWLTH